MLEPAFPATATAIHFAPGWFGATGNGAALIMRDDRIVGPTPPACIPPSTYPSLRVVRAEWSSGSTLELVLRSGARLQLPARRSPYEAPEEVESFLSGADWVRARAEVSANRPDAIARSIRYVASIAAPSSGAFLEIQSGRLSVFATGQGGKVAARFRVPAKAHREGMAAVDASTLSGLIRCVPAFFKGAIAVELAYRTVTISFSGVDGRRCAIIVPVLQSPAASFPSPTGDILHLAAVPSVAVSEIAELLGPLGPIQVSVSNGQLVFCAPDGQARAAPAAVVPPCSGSAGAGLIIPDALPEGDVMEEQVFFLFRPGALQLASGCLEIIFSLGGEQ